MELAYNTKWSWLRDNSKKQGESTVVTQVADHLGLI